MRAARTVLLSLATAAGSLVACGGPVHAQSGIQLDPSTPFEYWKDPCGYPDVIPSEYRIAGGPLQRLLSAEALLVPVGQIARRSDDPTFFRLTNTQLNYTYPFNGFTLAGEAPFIGELRLSEGGRSGYLVSPEIIATAAHVGFNPNNFLVVFDARALPNPSDSNTCVPFDPEHIPENLVYSARSTSPLVADTIVALGLNPSVDYAAFYLDRPATDRQYLRMRRSGEVSPGDHLVMIGHPFWLSTKLIYGVEYVGETAHPMYPQYPYPLLDNFYLLDGISGGAIYNLDRNYVETSVGTVPRHGCLYRDHDSSANVTYLDDLCDSTPELSPRPDPSSAAQQSYTVNGAWIVELANLVPSPYLQVEPLQDVEYIVPMNGVPSPAQTIYIAKASSTESSDTELTVLVAPSSAPQLLQIGSYASQLAPGASTQIAISASVPPGTSCGVYDRFVTIVDQTHGFRDRMRHRFDVGVKAFGVDPVEASDIYGIEGPSPHGKLAFTLTNERPTAVSVQVVSDQPWLDVRVIGSSSSPTVNLGAMGLPSSTKTVTASVNNSAFLLSDGSYEATVTFTATGDCVLSPPMVRTIVFHKGHISVSEEIDDFVPMPTPTGTPFMRTFEIEESFCISDAAVTLDTAYVGAQSMPIVGATLATWAQHLGLSLERTGMTPTASILLWDGAPLPLDWEVPTRYDGSQMLTTESLLLNSSAHSPPTGQTFLQQFGGRDAEGSWNLLIEDDGLQSSGRNQSYADSWTLDVWGYVGTCSN